MPLLDNPLSFNGEFHLSSQSQDQSRQLELDCKIQFFVSFSSMHNHPTILPDIVTKPAAANENQSPRRHAPRPQASPPREAQKRDRKRDMYNTLQKRQSMLPKIRAHHDRDRRIVSRHSPAFAHPPPLGPVPAPACQCSMLLHSVSSRDQKQRVGSRCA